MRKLITKTTAPVWMWALTAAPVLAQTVGNTQPPGITPRTSFTVDEAIATLSYIANVILALLSVIAVIMILLGAFFYITAGSDEGKLDRGKNLIIYGMVGVAVAILAFAIVTFVGSILQ